MKKSSIIILVVGLVVVAAAFGFRTLATKPLDGVWKGGVAYFDRKNQTWKYFASGEENTVKLNKDGTFEDPDGFQIGKWTQEGDVVHITIEQFNHRTREQDRAYYEARAKKKGQEISAYRKHASETAFAPFDFKVGKMNSEMVRVDHDQVFIYHRPG